MQRRPAAAAPSLSEAVSPPSHRTTAPPASQLSPPRTPPRRSSPISLFTSSDENRKSGDSWNSSNYEGENEPDVEWTEEETKLLLRTLDALPAHVITPFVGPVPPSNLLDKIARGVARAKGPVQWPHSLHATRVKLVELTRARAKEPSNDGFSDMFTEDGNDRDVLQQTTNIGPRRLLFRQSSMDYRQTDAQPRSNNEALDRIARRLIDDRIFKNPSFQSHTHPDRSPSPSPLTNAGIGSLRSPTTGTISDRLAECDSETSRLRRSMSDLSNSSDGYLHPNAEPALQPIKRAESFAGSMLYGPGQPLKRAPSFGGAARRNPGPAAPGGKDSDNTSSDEEERLRSIKAKKARMKALTPPPSPPDAEMATPRRQNESMGTPARKETPGRRVVKSNATPVRNSSTFGGELPRSPPKMEPSTPLRRSTRTAVPSPSPMQTSPPPQGPATRTLEGVFTPTAPSSTHKRGKRTSRLPSHLTPFARRLDFSSVISASVPEEDVPPARFGHGLASAFQAK